MGNGGILQLASQFNYLEATSRHQKTKVSEYLTDWTQGPQGSIEAAAAALHRAASEGQGKLAHALSDILPDVSSPYYENGYLELSYAPNLQDLYQRIDSKISQMKVLPQWVECESSGHTQLQVFCAAPSYQGSTPPEPNSWGEKICETLVSAQYEALAKLAVIRSLATNKVVNLHLTLVGQGAFNNPLSALRTSLQKVADIVKRHENVHVYIHAFDAQDEGKVQQSSSKDFFILRNMDKKEFMQTSNIS